MCTKSGIEDLEKKYNDLKTIIKNKIDELQIMESKAKEIGRDLYIDKFQLEIKLIRGFERDLDKAFNELDMIKFNKYLTTVEKDVDELKNECLIFMVSIDNLKNPLYNQKS